MLRCASDMYFDKQQMISDLAYSALVLRRINPGQDLCVEGLAGLSEFRTPWVAEAIQGVRARIFRYLFTPSPRSTKVVSYLVNSPARPGDFTEYTPIASNLTDV